MPSERKSRERFRPNLFNYFMKQFYLKSLIITLCVMNYLPSFSLTDYDCKVDGICYKLNQTEKTASVTYNDYKVNYQYQKYNYTL